MRSFRAIFAVMLALLWITIPNRCVLTASLEKATEVACCDDEGRSEDKDSSIPCSNRCTACVTLESGVNLAALVPVVAPMPVLEEISQFMEKLRTLAVAELTQEPEPVPVSPPIPPPAWQDDINTALPVRGPSLVA